jgi:hypothetical protein
MLFLASSDNFNSVDDPFSKSNQINLNPCSAKLANI